GSVPYLSGVQCVASAVLKGKSATAPKVRTTVRTKAVSGWETPRVRIGILLGFRHQGKYSIRSGAPERPNNFPAALAANYLAFTELASIRIWLRVYEFTP